jgi:putative Ca2+/H+ antiporter (TMEM165/GDT1 family)
MAGFFEIVVVAATAQFAVLPGEKVQFLIAGLSTRYHPFVVVSAAGAAFAGWTAIEIAFGSAIQGVFPPVVLDAITAGLFLLFAALLVRSARTTDGTTAGEATTDGSGIAAVEEYELPFVGAVPGVLGQFLPIFGMMAAGEFGDKTQLVTISLALEYGASPAIWVGEMLVIIPVSLANAVIFHRFSHRFNAWRAHMAGAAIFLFFGLDTILRIATGFSVWETVVDGIAGLVVGAF